MKNGLGDAHGKMGERRHAYNVLTWKPRGKSYLKNLSVEGMSKWNF
jgi:hypothetical protein